MEDLNEQTTVRQTGLGARFRAAREAMNLSEKEAALRLHLNPKIIAIIENENFENAPPATFMRGYLRSYARLLNFSENDTNLIIEQLGFTTPATTPISPALYTGRTSLGEERYTHWFTYIVLLGLAILVGLWWSSRSTTHTNKSVIQQATSPSVPEDSLVTPTESATTKSTQEQPTTTVVPTTQSPVALNTVPTTPAPTQPVTESPANMTPFTPLPQTPIPQQPADLTQNSAPTTAENELPKRHANNASANHVAGVLMATPEPGLATSEDSDYTN